MSGAMEILDDLDNATGFNLRSRSKLVADAEKISASTTGSNSFAFFTQSSKESILKSNPVDFMSSGSGTFSSAVALSSNSNLFIDSPNSYYQAAVSIDDSTISATPGFLFSNSDLKIAHVGENTSRNSIKATTSSSFEVYGDSNVEISQNGSNQAVVELGNDAAVADDKNYGMFLDNIGNSAPKVTITSNDNSTATATGAALSVYNKSIFQAVGDAEVSVIQNSKGANTVVTSATDTSVFQDKYKVGFSLDGNSKLSVSNAQDSTKDAVDMVETTPFFMNCSAHVSITNNRKRLV